MRVPFPYRPVVVAFYADCCNNRYFYQTVTVIGVLLLLLFMVVVWLLVFYYLILLASDLISGLWRCPANAVVAYVISSEDVTKTQDMIRPLVLNGLMKVKVSESADRKRTLMVSTSMEPAPGHRYTFLYLKGSKIALVSEICPADPNDPDIWT